MKEKKKQEIAFRMTSLPEVTGFHFLVLDWIISWHMASRRVRVHQTIRRFLTWQFLSQGLPRAYRLDGHTCPEASNFETPGKYVQRRQSSNESNEGQDYYLCAKSFGILNGNWELFCKWYSKKMILSIDSLWEKRIGCIQCRMIPIRRIPGSGFRELLSYESCQFIFHHDDDDDDDDATPPPQSKADFSFGFDTTHRPIL